MTPHDWCSFVDQTQTLGFALGDIAEVLEVGAWMGRRPVGPPIL